jgi:hypothetical protein
LCHMCGVEVETLLHAIWDCIRAKSVRRGMNNYIDPNFFNQSSLMEWLVGNMFGIFSSICGWSVMFAMVVDSYWFRWNYYIFNQALWNNSTLVIRSKIAFNELLIINCLSLQASQNTIMNPISYISCYFPPVKWIKINCDGDSTFRKITHVVLHFLVSSKTDPSCHDGTISYGYFLL